MTADIKKNYIRSVKFKRDEILIINRKTSLVFQFSVEFMRMEEIVKRVAFE